MDATPITTLPDDPAMLKEIIAQRDAMIEQIKQEATDAMEAER